jgi:hypothetical protein
LLLKVQSDVIAHLQKVLGKRAADLYQERLSQEMDDRCQTCPSIKTMIEFTALMIEFMAQLPIEHGRS